MKKIVILFYVFCLAFLPVAASIPAVQEHLSRGRAFYERGRWTDARYELLKAREGFAGDDRMAEREIDYLLAACGVELGREDAGRSLAEFRKRYPGSVYENDLRFAEASLLCSRGEYARAREAFEGVDYRALDARGRERYDIRMGYVAFAGGDYDAALRYLDRISPSSEYADHALYYKAYIAYARGDYAVARRDFGTLRTSQAYGPLAPYYLLQIEFRQGNYAYVTEHGEELVKRAVAEQRAPLERVLAESWFRQGDFNRTLAGLDAYAQAGGETGRDENYLKGFSLYRTARYDEAQEPLRLACGADDALTQNASYHLADCYLRAGDKRQAMHAFAMASSGPFDAAIAEDALFNYGKLQYELGGGVFNEAINVLGRYLEKYPGSERSQTARELLVAAYYNSRNYDAAYEAIRQVRSPDAEIRAAMQKIAYFRGLEAFGRGEMSDAQRYLAESASVGVSPRYGALAAFWQGEIAFAQGDMQTAAGKYADYLRRAPRSEREYALASYNLGYCALERGDTKGAANYFTQFLALHTAPDDYRADALNRLGDTHYAERRFEQAIRNYEAAAATGRPGRHYAAYKRAVTLGVLGRTQQKIDALKEIVRAGEGDYADDAAYELGRTYIGQEQYRSAVETLEGYIAAYPRSPDYAAALSDLGLAYLNLGDRRKSLACYDRVVAEAPKSSQARDALQGIRDIYVGDGNVDGYFAYAERTGVESDLSQMARDSLSFAAAQRLYLSGRTEDAARSLRGYLKSYPDGFYTADALYYLSDSYLKTGEREPAIEALTELASHENTKYTAAALRKLAGMTYEDKRWAEAASAYRRLADAVQPRSEKEEAMTRYVRATVGTGDAGAVVRMADDVAGYDAAGQTAWREAQFAKANVLLTRGEKAAALDLFRILSADVSHPEGAESMYRVIAAAAERGEQERAEKMIYAFADKNPPQAYWLARSFILLGDIYVQRGDKFQARATYQSVADGYGPAGDGIVEEARAKIEQLN